jgi:hypothetical protein
LDVVGDCCFQESKTWDFYLYIGKTLKPIFEMLVRLHRINRSVGASFEKECLLSLKSCSEPTLLSAPSPEVPKYRFRRGVGLGN